MKRYAFILGLLWCGNCVLMAQDSIVEALTRDVPGRGTVTIHQSSAIRQMIGRPVAAEHTEEVNGRVYLLFRSFPETISAIRKMKRSARSSKSRTGSQACRRMCRTPLLSGDFV